MAATRYLFLLKVLLVATQCCSTVTAGTIVYKKRTVGAPTTGQSQKGFSVLDCASICAKDASFPCRRFSYHADNKNCYLFNSTGSLDVSREDTYGRDCATHQGFTLYNSGHCLKHHKTPLNYTDAEKVCNNENSHLWTMEEMSDLGLFGTEALVYWIDGGKNRMTWYGTPLPWTMWAAGGYPESNECPCVISSASSMYTEVCTAQHPYICQIDC